MKFFISCSLPYIPYNHFENIVAAAEKPPPKKAPANTPIIITAPPASINVCPCCFINSIICSNASYELKYRSNILNIPISGRYNAISIITPPICFIMLCINLRSPLLYVCFLILKSEWNNHMSALILHILHPGYLQCFRFHSHHKQHSAFHSLCHTH